MSSGTSHVRGTPIFGIIGLQGLLPLWNGTNRCISANILNKAHASHVADVMTLNGRNMFCQQVWVESNVQALDKYTVYAADWRYFS